MNEYRIQWTQCPTAYNDSHILFVEAANPADALAIARDHIERKFGVNWLKLEVGESPSVPAGKVKP